jgi:ribosomal protein S18 acetylase RimI-like enzyme
MIRTRKAKLEDAPRIAELWLEMAEFHAQRDFYWEISRGCRDGYAAYTSKVITEDCGGVFVAHDDGKVVGFVMATGASRAPCYARQKVGLILDLAVTKGCRRKGAGEKLCNRALRWLSEKGFPSAEVRVATANPLAARFWEKMGFEPRITIAEKTLDSTKKKTR